MDKKQLQELIAKSVYKHTDFLYSDSVDLAKDIVNDIGTVYTSLYIEI